MMSWRDRSTANVPTVYVCLIYSQSFQKQRWRTRDPQDAGVLAKYDQEELCWGRGGLEGRDTRQAFHCR